MEVCLNEKRQKYYFLIYFYERNCIFFILIYRIDMYI